MAVISKDLGAVTAYAAAVNRGYTGTKEEFETLMASYATVAQQAAESAGNASQSATDASQSATDAETAKGTAQQAATDAQAAQASAQESAQSAQQSAQSASQSATDAESAKNTAVDAVDGFAAGAQQALDGVNQAGNNWKSLAQAKALDSEAYALGTRDGEDVGTSDPAYHNNAKYYALTAATDATTATEAAQTATQKASDAQASASAAAESARTLTIDATLTQSGQAADSKAVGDEIGEIKEDLSKLYESKELVGVDVYGYWRNGVFAEYNSPVTKEFVVSGLKETTLTTYANQYRDMYVFLTESKSVISYALGDGDYTSTGKTITINVPDNAVYLDSTTGSTASAQLIKATADLPTVTKEEVEQIQQEVDALSTSAVYKSSIVVLDMADSENGISIDKYGYKGNNSNYSVTNPFYVPKGATLNIVATGYQNATAILSEYVDGIYKPLVTSETGVTSYAYTTNKESHYAICFRTANTHSCEYTYSFDPIDIISILAEIENPEPEYLYLFHKMAGIGDSLMSGELYYSNENHRDAYSYSWLSNLARYGNAKCVHYSVGGMTAKAWLDDVGGCRTALENETEMSNVYFIGLGTNDKNQEVYSIGNASDTVGTASFAGYYKQIIEIIHTHNPNAYVFCLSMYDSLSASLPYSQIVSDIAGQYGYCYFVDFANNTEHTPKTSGTYAENSHFTSLGYLYAAQLIKRLVETIVSNNKDSFKWIGLND